MSSAIPHRMTAPRCVLPGLTYLVTRRCLERRFFLRPSRLTNEIFLYVLAVAAGRYGIDVHAFCVMSNHYHLLVTDTLGRLPEFMRYLDMLVARATNASLGRWETFWDSSRSYSAVAHDSAEDVVSKTAYVLANPVAAGLVRTGREWPGLWTGPEELGTARFVAARPKIFFREDGDMPASAELVLKVPRAFATAQEYQAAVAAATAALETQTRHEMQSKQRGFLGRVRVLAQKPFARPASAERRRGLNPRVASADKWKRMEALARLDDFLDAYRQARAKFCSGVRDVVFPAGTYLLRVHHGVQCAAAG